MRTAIGVLVAGYQLRLARKQARSGFEQERAGKLEYSPLATEFCRPEFTIAELRRAYETIWNVRLDPANLHRKVTGEQDFVADTGSLLHEGSSGPRSSTTDAVRRTGSALR